MQIRIDYRTRNLAAVLDIFSYCLVKWLSIMKNFVTTA